jgi:hypothetical protein
MCTVLAGCAVDAGVGHPVAGAIGTTDVVQALPSPGPPPPPVAVTMLFDRSLNAGAALQSKALLASLQGDYLLLGASAVPSELFSHCVAVVRRSRECVEELLDMANPVLGTVAIIVSPRAKGRLGWTCVGQPTLPFDGEHQRITWSPADAPKTVGGAWAPGIQRLAATCITYAGHQGGW